MVLLGVLGVEADARLALGRVAVHRRHRALGSVHEALRQGDDLVMVQVAGRADDQAVRDVAAAVVVGDLRHGRAGDHLGLAEDAAAERMVAVDGLGEEVVDAVRRLVLVHRDLLEHDLALGVDVREGRAEHHLGHQVERVLGVLVEEARVDVRGLLGSRGVRRRPHAVHLLGDLDRREALGALEEQVLEEVREPFLSFTLVAGAGPNPKPEGDGPDRGDDLGHDPYAARKRCELDVLRKGRTTARVR